MLRFGAAVAALLFLALAITARSAGTLGAALIGIVVCSTISIFAFAATRIDSNARGHVYVPTPEEIELMKQRAQRQRSEFERKQAQASDAEPDTSVD